MEPQGGSRVFCGDLKKRRRNTGPFFRRAQTGQGKNAVSQLTEASASSQVRQETRPGLPWRRGLQDRRCCQSRKCAGWLLEAPQRFHPSSSMVLQPSHGPVPPPSELPAICSQRDALHLFLSLRVHQTSFSECRLPKRCQRASQLHVKSTQICPPPPI